MSDQTRSPLQIGQVLRASIQVSAAGFLLYYVLAFVANSPNLALDILNPPPPPPWLIDPATSPKPEEPRMALAAGSPWLFAILGLAAIVVSLVMSATATYMMIARLRATPFRFVEALATGVRAIGPLLGVFIILLLIFFGIGIVALAVWAVLALGIAGDPKSPLGWIAVPLAVIPIFVIGIVLSLVVPVIVVERAGVFDSMRRSAGLTNGSRWRIFWLFVIVMILLTSARAVHFAIVLAASGPEAFASPTFLFTNHLLSAAIIVYFWAMTAVIYYKLRMAAESGPLAAA